MASYYGLGTVGPASWVPGDSRHDTSATVQGQIQRRNSISIRDLLNPSADFEERSTLSIFQQGPQSPLGASHNEVTKLVNALEQRQTSVVRRTTVADPRHLESTALYQGYVDPAHEEHEAAAQPTVLANVITEPRSGQEDTESCTLPCCNTAGRLSVCPNVADKDEF